MIETFFTALIKELGATGVMLLGLTLICVHVANKISAPLRIINGEIGEIRDLLKETVIRMKK